MNDFFTTVWSPEWGPPMDGALVHGIRSPHIGERGGVATMLKRPGIMFLDTELTSSLKPSLRKRVVHTRVALGSGRLFLHVVNVYAPSGDTPRGTVASREELLHTVLVKFREALGNVPLIVCGDLNTDVERSPTLRKALANDWCDVALLGSTGDDGKPPATFTRKDSAGTRIDYILLNSVAAHAIHSCWTQSINCIPSHKSVNVRLCLSVFTESTLRYIIPKQMPELGLVANAETVGRNLLQQHNCAAALASGDIDDAWEAIALAGEEFLLLAAKAAGDTLSKGFCGRSKIPHPVLKPVCAPTRPASVGGSSPRQDQLAKFEYKLTDLIAKTESCPGGVMENPVRNAWGKVFRTAITLKLMRSEETTIPLSLERQIQILNSLLEKSKMLMNLEIRNTRLQREKQYTTKLKVDFSSERRKRTAWCMGKQGVPISALRGEDGVLTANHREMDKLLRDEWKSVFNLYDHDHPEPTLASFEQRFGSFVAHSPMSLDPLSGADLRRTLDKKGKRTDACGTDGWRSLELHAMPLCILDGFARVFNAIETNGVWPQALLTALVTLLPKGEDQSPLKLRPVTVTSAVYRLWACARLQAVQQWQEQWVHPSQHGFRPKHSTNDVLYDVFTQMEDALLGGEPLHGLALDFAKCFDRVPQGLTLDLVEKMGLHPRIMTPLRAMYAKLRRRFKLPSGVGEAYSVTNGILQGCPLSVVLINALMSVLTHCITAEVPEAFVRSFADDAYLLSRHSEASVGACLLRVEDFCRITGMRLNMAKTFAFSSLKNHKCKLKSEDNHRFRTTESLRSLGVMMYSSLRSKGRYNATVYQSAVRALSCLGATPLSFSQKVSIATSAILPSVLYESAFNMPPQSVLNELTKAVAMCCWGPTYLTRSVDALLTLCLKAHMAHPLSSAICRTFRTYAASVERNDAIRQRCMNIRERYETLAARGTPMHAVGPVGTVLAASRRCGVSWDPEMKTVTSTSATAKTTPIIEIDKAKRAHEVRVLARTAVWDDLQSKRPTYDGINDGIDTRATNALWRNLQYHDPLKAFRMRRVLCGGVLFCHPDGLKRSGLPEADFSDKCPLCLVQVTCHTRHLLWHCSIVHTPAFTALHASAISLYGKGLPTCFVLHGIVPSNVSKVTVKAVQSLLLDAVTTIDTTLSSPADVAPAVHPWNLTFAASKRDTPFRTYLTKLQPSFSSTYREAFTLKAFLWWVITLEWSKEPRDVSCVELAVDFELRTRVFLAKQTSNIRERGRAMQRLIVKANMRALTAKLRRAPFPGVKRDRVHSLRSVGAPALIGFSRRPVLCAKTRAFLESLNHVVPPSRSGWGNDCIPAYSFPVNQTQAQHSGVR